MAAHDYWKRKYRICQKCGYESIQKSRKETCLMKATALLSQTAEEVRQTLETFETYSFAQDVQSRMVHLQLFAVAITAMW